MSFLLDIDVRGWTPPCPPPIHTTHATHTTHTHTTHHTHHTHCNNNNKRKLFYNSKKWFIHIRVHTLMIKQKANNKTTTIKKIKYKKASTKHKNKITLLNFINIYYWCNLNVWLLHYYKITASSKISLVSHSSRLLGFHHRVANSYIYSGWQKYIIKDLLFNSTLKPFVNIIMPVMLYWHEKWF